MIETEDNSKLNTFITVNIKYAVSVYRYGLSYVKGQL